ncbi:Phosphate-starvation-inducible E [Shewanella psychrophila]|uniref:Phosphate-starvation-inducible E n=1 Tax=Shewanella psychrophila TaxID=225848 RepID=A0A1S6HV86_9GAMM|nr:phosphate-starvation-inducible PsiE family protein [Shewanella psychrophila]AQS39392.1 Phosphate-starvation-inducible E [Shewanella psychrophila]
MTLVILWSVIDVQIVIATALMAISRKIIVLDFKEVDAEYVWLLPP